MSLATGARLGPYEILAAIGAGGMGEVYRARDTRLDRIVAIKVLAPDIAADPDQRARFEREAKTISALDHPHICALYDIGEEEGVRFLVMQYLEGETLADRLARQPMTLDEAFHAAIQMAAALDAAHRMGIVHRDLKPGNVMLTKSGTKLLDFGLAKIGAAPHPVAGVTLAATRSAPLTQQGSILGTLQYMSPEQLEGRDADARSDIFAFGTILYEMLTGRRAFDAGSQAGIIAAILTAEPRPVADAAPIRDGVPAPAGRALDRLLKKCLAKKADDRWQSAADLRDELIWIDEERRRRAQAEVTDGQHAGPHTAPAMRRGWRLTAAAVAGVVIGALGSAWLWPRAAAPSEIMRFTIEAPAGNALPPLNLPVFMAVSPDGRTLAFSSGTAPGKNQLWLRSLDFVTARAVPDTDQAWNPIWSPDSRYVVFTTGTAGGTMKKVDTLGGQSLTLADWGVPNAWSPQGIILFQGRDRQLYRVADTGGTPSPVTSQNTQEAGYAGFFFLRDGRHFVMQAAGRSRNWYVASVDDSTRKRLEVPSDLPSFMVYANGHVLYHREGTLLAQRFDDVDGRVFGDAVPIAQSVNYASNGRATLSVSANGVLAYRTGLNTATSTLTWIDRAGKAVGTIPVEGVYANRSRPQLSPDGHQIVVSRRESNGPSDVWIIDLDRGIPTRITFDPADDDFPIWTPDGQQIIFRSQRPGGSGLYRHSSAGGGSDEPLPEASEAFQLDTISPDGKNLLFGRSGAATGIDIWALPMTGDRKPFPVVVTPYQEGQASFSPDGRWFAYCVNDSGPDQVYVERFPPNGTRIRLSTTGGSSPVWSRDGRTVFYSTQENHIMAVDVTVEPTTVKAGIPQELFVAPGPMFFHFGFSVDATGTRFLLPASKQEPTEAPITIVLNWTAGLPKR